MSIARQTELATLEHDAVSRAKATIDASNSFINRGLGFFMNVEVGALAAAASESYSFKTPTSKYIHITHMELSGIGASVKLEIIRGTTANPLTIDSAGDTASEVLGPHNANDNLVNGTGVTVKKTPTYTDSEEGETWDSIVVLGTSTNQYKSVASESHGQNTKLVLKPNVYYVFKFTNLSAGDAATSVLARMFWFEETRGIA